ncbi:MAG: hypothetical protein QXO71_09995 [Candidatus Jordarchaeaceae archaeon]
MKKSMLIIVGARTFRKTHAFSIPPLHLEKRAVKTHAKRSLMCENHYTKTLGTTFLPHPASSQFEPPKGIPFPTLGHKKHPLTVLLHKLLHKTRRYKPATGLS